MPRTSFQSVTVIQQVVYAQSTDQCYARHNRTNTLPSSSDISCMAPIQTARDNRRSVICSRMSTMPIPIGPFPRHKRQAAQHYFAYVNTRLQLFSADASCVSTKTISTCLNRTLSTIPSTAVRILALLSLGIFLHSPATSRSSHPSLLSFVLSSRQGGVSRPQILRHSCET